MGALKIMKFGGTSVGTPERMETVLHLVSKAKNKGELPVVVLSAMGGVTNRLNQLAEVAMRGRPFTDGVKQLEHRHFEAARTLMPIRHQNPVLTQIRLILNELEEVLQGIFHLGELSSQSRDRVLSFGERLSTVLIHKVAEQRFPEQEIRYLDARQIIRTNSQFGQAQVLERETAAAIRALFQTTPQAIFFVTGFIGSDEQGRTTTLGRGGSDYTAALLGAALDANAIEIWTDVDGMLTADPRHVKKAISLPELSYAEAMELSYFGAKVIYPPTMIPAFRTKIPIFIKNTFNPSFEGTAIRHSLESAVEEQLFSIAPSSPCIKGISSIPDISLINLTGGGMVGKAGFSGRLFSLLAREGINVVLITQSSSEHSITFAVHPDDLPQTRRAIELEFELEIQAQKLATPQVEEGLSVLAIVGEHMKRTPGVSGKLFHALGRNGINVRAIAQGSSELNISFIVRQSDLSKAMNAVHDAFFSALNKTLHVFCVGTGKIGSTLLDQLRDQYETLLHFNDLEIKLVGLANSRSMLLDADGISLSHWRDELVERGEITQLSDFVERMKALNLPNAVFVDNTASEKVANFYLELFRANISVVTSNKIANSGPYHTYQALRETARKHGVDFNYETNVGAGLPIVRVLKDLRLSGDRVIQVQAVLSGTISYIFNNFQGNRAFHEVVEEAQRLGFTEPDPRDDLNGKDFLRKMLIIARDAGYTIEETQVELEPIIPESCLRAPNVETFYQALVEAAPHFEALKKNAEQEGKVLRYIGELREAQVSIRLQAVGPDHPFYHLTGSDNIIAFTTHRYQAQALVVKGPGAGAEVTAGGVFADLVQVGTRKCI